MTRQELSELEREELIENNGESYNPRIYEKPTIRRHAVIMTMAPQGSKMGHGLFPFATRNGNKDYSQSSRESPYRRA